MKVDKETLNKIAHLARLEINEEEEENMLASLSDILTWVDKLNELDTDEVEPLTNMSHEINAVRDDKIGMHLEHERAMKNAPDRDNDFFRVPKVKE